MPKQDLAEFAEALVNLSSLQRRVNSGFETVERIAQVKFFPGKLESGQLCRLPLIE